MNEQQHQQYYYPKQLGRIILISMEEVIGRIGVNAVLNQANLSHLIDNYPEETSAQPFTFEEMCGILKALEDIYGPRGGRGLALRTGRLCFKHGLREFGPSMGFSDLAFRLLPMEVKLRTCVDVFAGIYNQYTDQKVLVDEDNEYYYWKIERCPLCWQRHTDAPICHLMVGLMQEAMYWVSVGKFYTVEETECIAKGDLSCTVSIGKKYLE